MCVRASLVFIYGLRLGSGAFGHTVMGFSSVVSVAGTQAQLLLPGNTNAFLAVLLKNAYGLGDVYLPALSRAVPLMQYQRMVSVSPRQNRPAPTLAHPLSWPGGRNKDKPCPSNGEEKSSKREEIRWQGLSKAPGGTVGRGGGRAVKPPVGETPAGVDGCDRPREQPGRRL